MDKQKHIQRAFLTMALGGPGNYHDRRMRDAYKKTVDKDLNDTHFNIVVSHLATTKTEMGVPGNYINDVATHSRRCIKPLT